VVTLGVDGIGSDQFSDGRSGASLQLDDTFISVPAKGGRHQRGVVRILEKRSEPLSVSPREPGPASRRSRIKIQSAASARPLPSTAAGDYFPHQLFSYFDCFPEGGDPLRIDRNYSMIYDDFFWSDFAHSKSDLIYVALNCSIFSNSSSTFIQNSPSFNKNCRIAVFFLFFYSQTFSFQLLCLLFPFNCKSTYFQWLSFISLRILSVLIFLIH
jgi:hypothetical protein